MKKLIIISLCVALGSCTTTHKTLQFANIVEEGCIDCFAEGLKATCETSAIVESQGKILVANDKDMPDGRTSVFGYANASILADSTQRQYQTNEAFKYGKKYEDFAKSTDGKWIFLTTAFDRVKEGSKDWDAYNTILYWPLGSENSPKVLSETANATNSMDIRLALQKALANADFPDKMPYIKVEGLAFTSNKVYFGIREVGKSFQDFKTVIKIIEGDFADFKISNLKVISDLSIPQNAGVETKMGLSGLEFNPSSKKFVILTSYEAGENLGGAIFTATLEQLKANQMQVVKGVDGKALTFKHKIEDIAFIDKNTAILISDDDRVKTNLASGQQRKTNQGVYLKLKWR